MPRPSASDHAPFYANYIAKVPGDDPVAAMKTGLAETMSLLGGLNDEVAMTRHAPYTWSIKQVVGHLIDCERIFGYRALRIARGDSTPLAGFEENDYIVTGEFDARSLPDLLAEFDLVRRSHIAFFESLPGVAWDRRGVANGSEVTVRAAAFILAGHERHHVGVVRTRLGLA